MYIREMGSTISFRRDKIFTAVLEKNVCVCVLCPRTIERYFRINLVFDEPEEKKYND
jgi:hypothetical protein